MGAATSKAGAKAGGARKPATAELLKEQQAAASGLVTDDALAQELAAAHAAAEKLSKGVDMLAQVCRRDCVSQAAAFRAGRVCLTTGAHVKMCNTG
jgi:hypothetical protein